MTGYIKKKKIKEERKRLKMMVNAWNSRYPIFRQTHMSRGKYLAPHEIDGVFLPRSPFPRNVFKGA